MSNPKPRDPGTPEQGLPDIESVFVDLVTAFLQQPDYNGGYMLHRVDVSPGVNPVLTNSRPLYSPYEWSTFERLLTEFLNLNPPTQETLDSETLDNPGPRIPRSR